MQKSNFETLDLHVFSGTGNSLRAAGWVAERFGGKEVRLVRIAMKNDPLPRRGGGTLTGLIFPTHGFTAPWAVMRHTLRLPRGEKGTAFVIAARAGTWPGFPLPGLSASAMFIAAFLLLVRGYRIRGLMGLDMPSNWMSIHWGISTKISQKIISRARPKTEAFIDVLLADGRRLMSAGNVIEFVLGAALLPVSAAYLLMGRFGLAKLFYANWRCNSCGLCARECPMGAIIIKGRGSRHPYWTFSCESCMHCMAYCPVQAVEASHPLAVAFYFISTFSLAGFIGAILVTQVPGSSLHPLIAGSVVISTIIDYIYVLISFYVSYFLFHLLVRVPAINRFFTCLTLTHYYRRYHEPGTEVTDFHKTDPR